MKNSQIQQSINSSVGRSEATPIKQEHLKAFFNAQLYKTTCVFNKHKWIDSTYHLFDITAGDASPNETLTSPTIFLDGLYLSKKLKFEAVFVEKKKNIFDKLEQNVFNYIECMPDEKDKNYFSNATRLIHGESKQALGEYYKEKHEYAYGLLYYDGNGFKNKLWNTATAFSKTWPRLDIIANISPVQINRNRGVQKKPGFTKYNKRLPEIINQIDKKEIYIRDSINTYDYQNKFQHIMLFFTNFGDYTKMLQHGFYKLESEQGQEIIHSHL